MRPRSSATSSEYLRSCVCGGRALVVDMTAVEFFGVQGILKLFEIDDECGRAGVDWQGYVADHGYQVCYRERRRT